MGLLGVLLDNIRFQKSQVERAKENWETRGLQSDKNLYDLASRKLRELYRKYETLGVTSLWKISYTKSELIPDGNGESYHMKDYVVYLAGIPEKLEAELLATKEFGPFVKLEITSIETRKPLNQNAI